MEDLNRRAARAIFRENNEHRDEHTIDLHGLFVKVSVVIQDLTRKLLTSMLNQNFGHTSSFSQEI